MFDQQKITNTFKYRAMVTQTHLGDTSSTVFTCFLPSMCYCETDTNTNFHTTQKACYEISVKYLSQEQQRNH